MRQRSRRSSDTASRRTRSVSRPSSGRSKCCGGSCACVNEVAQRRWQAVARFSAAVARHAEESHARKPYPLARDEQRLLFSWLPKHLSKMALFQVNTGTRETEVCALRWEWEQTVSELGTKVFIVPAGMVKNAEDRLIVLNDTAKAVIESRRKRSLRGQRGADSRRSGNIALSMRVPQGCRTANLKSKSPSLFASAKQRGQKWRLCFLPIRKNRFTDAAGSISITTDISRHAAFVDYFPPSRAASG